jgi:hypothetical protein
MARPTVVICTELLANLVENVIRLASPAREER